MTSLSSSSHWAIKSAEATSSLETCTASAAWSLISSRDAFIALYPPDRRAVAEYALWIRLSSAEYQQPARTPPTAFCITPCADQAPVKASVGSSRQGRHALALPVYNATTCMWFSNPFDLTSTTKGGIEGG